jgi:transcriptional regulator GlxA family with amidase domain
VRIAVYAFDGVTMFHLAVPQMVFDEVRRLGLGEWECVLFADRAGPVRTAKGLRIEGVAGPEAAADADLVVVPSWHEDGRVPGAVLRRVLAEARGRRAAIAGLCLGAIPLADAGLLAGRTAVTHWTAFGLLAERHPDLVLDETVLYIDHGDVLTAAGTASGLDACLHIVRTRLGSESANRVARSLVVAPHREGGQAQYIERPVAVESASGTIGEVLEWAEAHGLDPVAPAERGTTTARDHGPPGRADRGPLRLRQRRHPPPGLPGRVRHVALALPLPLPRRRAGRVGRVRAPTAARWAPSDSP